MDIKPALRDDVERLIESLGGNPAAQHHIRGRWDTQQRGDGLYLLAHRDGEIAGQTMLLRHSKYDEVRAAEDPAEINGLHAHVQGQGIGTALIRAAEAITAGEWQRPFTDWPSGTTTRMLAGCTSGSGTNPGPGRALSTVGPSKRPTARWSTPMRTSATTC